MSSLLRTLFNTSSKHKKLSEEWATTREPVVEGLIFYCKYLGSTLVDDPKSETSTSEAIKRIIQSTKQVGRKPERVSLQVSLEGIRLENVITQELMLETSIYKISYCSADAHYDHVFAFIATSDNETCECHAFLCPKRKMAQAVTISIAQAFNLAYECWKLEKDKKNELSSDDLPVEVELVPRSPVETTTPPRHNQNEDMVTSTPLYAGSDHVSSDVSTSGYQSSVQGALIELEEQSELDSSNCSFVPIKLPPCTKAQPPVQSQSSPTEDSKLSSLRKHWASLKFGASPGLGSVQFGFSTKACKTTSSDFGECDQLLTVS